MVTTADFEKIVDGDAFSLYQYQATNPSIR